MEPKTAKIFMNGRSQAVRLPKEYRFNSQEVLIFKQGSCVVLCPKTSSWNHFFEKTPLPSEDFMSQRTNDVPQQREEIF